MARTDTDAGHAARSFTDTGEEEGLMLLLCGALGLVGAIVPLVTMVWAAGVAEHDFVADTVSDLGRGPHHAIMDTGFYVNAAGMLALAIGAAHAHLGRMLWTLSVFALALLALNVVAIGLWDAFGRTSEGEGTSVHTWLTFGLGPLYLVGPLAMVPALRPIAPGTARLFVASAVGWIVLATAFKLSPDAIDGGVEKLAIAATLLWTVPLSWLLLRRAWTHGPLSRG
ncbi:MAG: DUF998 domain-containing protein [Shimia sp.]